MLRPEPKCYKALRDLVLIDTNKWISAGEIVDLSNRPDTWIAEYIRRGMIETADGDPVNVPGELPEAVRN